MTLINLLGTMIFIVIGYLIGSLLPAIIISKRKFTADIRNYHSKNAGAANAIRVMGKKWGIFVLFADGFKPVIITLIAYSLTFINITNPMFKNIFRDANIYFSTLASIIGHCWPIYFRFRGGKGAACALGLLLIINPLYFFVALATWWILLYFYRMSSLSSIIMVGPAFIMSCLPNIPATCYLKSYGASQNYLIIILIALTWVIIIIRHYENIIRIIKKNERKVTIFDKLDQKLKFKPFTAK